MKAFDTFGKLTALVPLHQDEHGHRYWLFGCDCGTAVKMLQNNVASGRSTQCKECANQSRKWKKSKVVGGVPSKEHPLYCTWRNMIDRCRYDFRWDYQYYGGRGITVCSRWESFELFVADMGVPPTEDHTLDRINNDGNYEPGNCRWATWSEQRLNR
jgi:hypothetical protein